MADKNLSSKTSGFAIASLILGILGLIPYTFGALSILALVFAIVSLNQVKKNANLGGKGIAIGGLLLGIAGIIFLIVIVSIGFKYGGTVKSVGCKKADFDIPRYDDKIQFFYNRTTNEVSFLIQNAPNVDLEGINVKMIGAQQVQEENIVGKLEANGMRWYNIIYDINKNGLIKEVRIYPVVLDANNKTVVCPQHFPLLLTEG